MIFYFILIIIIFLASPICWKRIHFMEKYIRGKNLYLKIITFAFIIVMGCRADSVGTDTAPYARGFAKIGLYPTYKDALEGISNTAPVFILINRICYKISTNPQLFVFIMAVLINIALYYFIKKTSVDYPFSAYLFMGLTFFYYGMNGSRQTLAILIALNAVLLLIDNIKSKKGWLLFLIGIGIHLTCLIMFVAIAGIIFVNKIRNRKIMLIVFSATGTIATMSLAIIVRLISKYFPHYIIYISGQASAQILEPNSKGRIVVVYLFLLLFIFLWVIKKPDNLGKIDKIFNNLMPMMVFGVAMGIINCRNELINRLMWYFIATFITFIPYICKSVRNQYQIILKSGAILLLILYNVLFLYENQSGVYPYLFFWN